MVLYYIRITSQASFGALMPTSKGIQQAISVLASAATDAIRTEMLSGKEHVVVPIIALLEGVWQSAVSEYPELALASEFGNTPEGWNGRPVTLGHPKREGSYVSAGRPDVFEQDVVGTIFNTKLEDKKLKMEAWIEKDKVDTIGDRAQTELTRLQAGELVEVSTGLFMSLEDSEGLYNGEEFHGVWRNIIPDHLALLPAGVLGACSVADGAGAPRLNQMRTMSKGLNMSKNASIKMNLSAAAFSRIQETSNGSFKLRNQAAISAEDTSTAVRAALISEEKDVDGGYWIVALFTDTVVYCKGWGSALFQRTYKIEDAGTVVLGTTVTAVRPVTEFVPIDVQIKGESSMTIQEKVVALLTKKPKTFLESDKAWLESFSEEQLDKVIAATESEVTTVAEVTTEVVNATVTQGTEVVTTTETEEPVTLEGFLNNAPAEIREVLNEGIQMQRNAKNELVSKLRSNKSCEFSEIELKSMSLLQLGRLAKLAKVPNYAGNVGATAPTVNQTQEQFMPAPVVFTREQK